MATTGVIMDTVWTPNGDAMLSPVAETGANGRHQARVAKRLAVVWGSRGVGVLAHVNEDLARTILDHEGVDGHARIS